MSPAWGIPSKAPAAAEGMIVIVFWPVSTPMGRMRRAHFAERLRGRDRRVDRACSSAGSSAHWRAGSCWR